MRRRSFLVVLLLSLVLGLGTASGGHAAAPEPFLQDGATVGAEAAEAGFEPVLDSVVAGRIRVFHAPGQSLRARRLLRAIEERARFPGLPAELPSPVRAYLAPDEETFAALTGGAVPEWGAAVAIPSRDRIVLPAYASERTRWGPAEESLRHELAHIALHQYLEGLRIPRWFDEGYARWASGQWDAGEAWRLRLALAGGGVPSLDSLTLAWPRGRASAELAYLLSASAVEYLTLHGGERALRAFLERWREEGSMERALRRVYGITGGQLEEEWRRHVKDRYGGLFLLTRSSVLWLFLAIGVIVLAWIRRRRDREAMARLRAAEDPFDGNAEEPFGRDEEAGRFRRDPEDPSA